MEPFSRLRPVTDRKRPPHQITGRRRTGQNTAPVSVGYTVPPPVTPTVLGRPLGLHLRLAHRRSLIVTLRDGTVAQGCRKLLKRPTLTTSQWVAMAPVSGVLRSDVVLDQV
ncbi:hypothetical protein GCM10010307_34640 [Streptomyces vastus]|uniref:Uncharacterized protein n=1 Tax=Streptomyces vastus TaxID=285451 RepID=A0ABP6D9K5_9ACTN